MRKILPTAFFAPQSPLVAKNLLGKFLVRVIDGEEVALMITEVEAYNGEEDGASHARFGRTKRNEPMFGPPGYTYVHFTYGMHWMLNLVCGPAGHPSGVLVRAAGDIVGPARLTKALHIDKPLNNRPLGRELGLWVEDRGIVLKPSMIQTTPRIGIAYAGAWIEKPWRFVVKTEKKKTASRKK